MIKRLIKRAVLAWYRSMTKLLPVQKDTIVFMSNLGRSYGGSPKSIYEQLAAQGLCKKYRCFFVLENPDQEIAKGGKTVKISRLRYYYVMAVAGVIISDTRFQNYMIKRKGVTYIQTWHGTPLKKLALDMESCQMAGNESIEEYRSEFMKNSATWDYLIVQNEFSAEIFPHAFSFHKTLLRTGYPRNDVLFAKNNPSDIAALRKKYRIPKGKKVILYAPTWRDNSYYNKESYRMDAPLDYSLLYEQLNKEYVFLIKYHYMVREKHDFSVYDDFYRVVPGEADIAELYLISDLLITDYSSVMFDYSLLKRPMIFYVYDIMEYRDELRGFYFDFVKEAPGPLVTTTEELVSSICHYDADLYQKLYKDFCKKYHTYENGTASKQIVNLITDLTQNKNV